MASNQRPTSEPSPEQIRAACLKLQEQWTPEEELRRRGCRRLPAAISAVRQGLTSYRFAEVAEPRE